MINLVKSGTYQLIETKGQAKILTLDAKETFAWIVASEIGEILVASYKQHKTDHILAIGEYKLYEVADEPDLADLPHLELQVGDNVWQGYLLPTGLPTLQDKKNRIIPTAELITNKIL